VSSWRNDLVTFQEQIGKVSEDLQEIAKQFKEFHNCAQEVRQLQVLKLEVVEANAGLLDLLPPKRSKRGLFNLGGKAIRMLFGNPDADEYDAVKERLRRLENSEAEVVHSMEAHLTLTRQLGVRTEQIAQEVKRQTGIIVGEVSRLKYRLRNLDKAIRTLDHRVELAMNVSSILRTLEVSALKALLDIRNLNIAIESLSANKLGVSLLSPLELSRILTNVSMSLPPGLALIASPEPAELFRYYDLLDIHGFATDGTITVIIEVPLRSRGTVFDLYRVHILPVKDEATGVHSLIETEVDYLIVSSDAEFYAELKEYQLTLCRRRRMWVCPASFPLRSRHTASCLSSLMLRGTEEDCRRVVLSNVFPTVWLWDHHSTSWVYSTSGRDHLVSHCTTGDRSVVTETAIEGVGRIEAARGCSLTTKAYKILPNSRCEGATHVTKRINVIVPTATLNSYQDVPREEVESALQEATLEGWSIGTREDLFGVPEDTLRTLVTRRREQQDRQAGVIVGLCVVSGGLAIVLLPLILWKSGVWQWCQKRRSHQQGETRPTPAERRPYYIPHPSGGVAEVQWEEDVPNLPVSTTAP